MDEKEKKRKKIFGLLPHFKKKLFTDMSICFIIGIFLTLIFIKKNALTCIFVIL